MATVSYSVPDEIKNRFNQIFSNQNKSHLITKLMQEAIEEHEHKQQRVQAVDALLKLRTKQKPISDKTIRTARHRNRS